MVHSALIIFLKVLIWLGFLIIAFGVFGLFLAQRRDRMRVRSYRERQKTTGSRRVFVAFRTTDQEIAHELKEKLDALGYLVEMWDPANSFPDPKKSIAMLIDNATYVIFVDLSKASNWMAAEYSYAAGLEKHLLHCGSRCDIEKIIELLPMQGTLPETSYSAGTLFVYDLLAIFVKKIDPAGQLESDIYGELSHLDMLDGLSSGAHMISYATIMFGILISLCSWLLMIFI